SLVELRAVHRLVIDLKLAAALGIHVERRLQPARPGGHRLTQIDLRIVVAAAHQTAVAPEAQLAAQRKGRLFVQAYFGGEELDDVRGGAGTVGRAGRSARSA